MVDLMKLDEKDKAIVFFSSKSGKYLIKEVVLHDKNTAALLVNAQKLADDLNAGRAPALPAQAQEKPLKLKFECLICNTKDIPAFKDKPKQMFLPCAKCGKWTNHKQTVV